jgi:hypothetical protein
MVMDGMDVQIIDLRIIVLQKIDHQNTVHLKVILMKVDHQIIGMIGQIISKFDLYAISMIIRS